MDRMRHVRALLSRISLSWPLLCFVFIVFLVFVYFYSGFPKETPELKFGRLFFFSFGCKSQSTPHHVCAVSWLWRIRHVLTNEHMVWCKADEEKLSRCKISADILYNTLKTHTKYAHIVRGRATLKNVEHFPNKSVREPYEKSLYEWSFISGPFIEEHAINWVIQC